MKQIDVLGTTYSIHEADMMTDQALEQCDGYCDETVKVCVIDSMKNRTDPMSKQDIQKYKNQVVRHELVHAFLFESGLGNDSWAANEEIVDWIAAMFPKLKDAFEQLKVG